MTKRSIEVEIMGEKVTLRSDAEEAYVRKVAGFVDKKMQEVSRAVRPAAKSSVAMLAALNIADEYQRLKDNHEVVLQRLGQLSKRLSISLTEEG
jgi:cell division protein ZapA